MPTPTDAAPVQAGDVLDGKYRVEKVLGMGVVVAARHLELGTRVALKFLLPHLAQDPVAVGRFQREARAAVRLRSVHAAKVHDVGRLATGSPYLVMEFLHGADLATVLSRRHPLPVLEAVGFMLQACEAIAEAHALQLIHRDLKPQNIFLTRGVDGSPLIKVLDFGLAKSVLASTGEALTTSNSILGSPAYMSPEQLRVEDLDGRTDIWSLGVCLFELLTNRLPFEASAMAGLCVKVLSERAPSVRAVRADVPPKLDAVIERCLSKERGDRFASVADLGRALEPFGPLTMRGAGDRMDTISATAPLRDAGSVPPAAVDPEGKTQLAQRYVETHAAAVYDSKPRSASVGGRKTAVALWAGVTALVLVAVFGRRTLAILAHPPPAPAQVGNIGSALQVGGIPEGSGGIPSAVDTAPIVAETTPPAPAANPTVTASARRAPSALRPAARPPAAPTPSQDATPVDPRGHL